MADEEKFFYEALHDCQTIKEFIHTLQEGLDKGVINLSTDKESLTIYPPKIVKLSIKARKKANNTKLDLKLTWEDKDEKDQEDINFKIS